MPRIAESGFDAAVVDRQNRAVALIQVKAYPVDGKWEAIVRGQLERSAEHADFVMTIDPTAILLYRVDGSNLVGPIVDLDTPQILQHYDPEFPKRRVFESYLLTLVEAWLRDLAYHWKSENPPGAEVLRRAGLLEKMEGGTTQRIGA
jgi:hypothetical protein